VSAVRQQLLASDWAAEQRGGGLLVTNPEAILDAWAKSDDWEKRNITKHYSVVAQAEPFLQARKLDSILGNARPAFTQWVAASLRHPHTTSTIVTAYVPAFPSKGLIENHFLAREVDEGGNLRLVVPKDEGVFHPAQEINGVRLVSDVQIYLDLLGAGQRGDEQAAELRKWPDFAGGWK